MTKNIKQKVITVFEIGFAEHGHYDDDAIEFIDFQEHFVRYRSSVPRYIVSTSIVEIGDFELNVTKVKCIKPKHWWEHEHKEIEIVGRCSGSWLNLVDGRRIYVHESIEELIKMIEED